MKSTLGITKFGHILLFMLFTACNLSRPAPVATLPFSVTATSQITTPTIDESIVYPEPRKCKLASVAGLPIKEGLKTSHILYRAGQDLDKFDQIWVMNVSDGSRKLVLDHLPYPYYHIGLLSDSFHFVLVDVGKLWLSDLDGSPPKLVNMLSEKSEILKNFPAYSRVRYIYDDVQISESSDGKRYATWNLGDQSLVISDSQTNTKVEVLRYDNHGYIAGNWSPDGENYAITYSKPFEDEYSRVYVVKSNGTNLREVARYKNVDLGRPYWSSDGHKIVFTVHKFMQSSPTYYRVLSLITGEIKTIAIDAEESLAWRDGSDIIWSPDNQWILVYIQEPKSDKYQYDIVALNVITGDSYCITDDNLVEIMADWR